MPPAPSPRRLLILAAALVAATALSPAAASAAKVQGLGPWKADNAYLVRVDLDGRKAPKLRPVAKVNHVKAGQWIRIQCQATGENAYGSRVWIKTGGLYVPDHYVKTYTDGFLAGVPTCGATAPKPSPQPSGPSQATLAKAIRTVTYERVYGSHYRIKKSRFPRARYPSGPGIIWKKNGCSVPAALTRIEVGAGPWLRGRPVAYYAKLFTKSCDRHDFGYRNYGTDAGGRALDPTESRRTSIDKRFGRNLDHQCRRIFSRKVVEAAQRGACYKAADAFELAVGKRGKPHFFR